MGLLKINKARLKNMKVAKSAGFLLLIFLLSGTFALAKTINVGTAGDNILLNGNTGVGVGAPGQIFTISTSSPIIKFQQTSGIVYNWALASQYSTTNTFEITPSTAVGGNIFSTPAMAIRVNESTGAANVGIGTTAPGSILEINSAVPILTINGTTNNAFRGINFATGGSVQANILSNIYSGELRIQSGTSGYGGYLTFNLDGSERARLQATTGNFGINTTAPTSKLNVSNGVSGLTNTATFNSNVSGANEGVTIRLATAVNGSNDWYAAEIGAVTTVATPSWRNPAMIFRVQNTSTYLPTDIVERMRITSDGYVGISTTTPNAKLQVYGGTGQVMSVSGGQIGGLNSVPLNADQAVPLGYLQANYSPTSGNLWSGTLNGTIYNGTAGAGNVGIGTTTPGAKLAIHINQSGGTVVPYVNFHNDASGYAGWALKKTNLNDISMYNDWDNVPVMTWQYVSGAGNVGIGTTVPGAKLDVKDGNIYISGSGLGLLTKSTNSASASNIGFIRFDGTHTPSGTIYTGPSIDAIKEDANYATALTFTNTTNVGARNEIMRINSGGNVGIGTTNPGTNKLHVYTGASGGAAYEAGGLTVESAGRSAIQLLSPNASDSYLFFGDVAGGNRAYVGHFGAAMTPANLMVFYSIGNFNFSGGNVGIGTTAPGDILHIKSSTGANNLRLERSGTTLENTLALYTGTTEDWEIGTALASVGSDFDFYKFAAPAGLVMRLTTGGNVGIGTTGPTNKFHVNAGTGQAMTVAGGQIGGLNSVPLNADQAVPLGYLQANYSPTSGNLWNGTLNGTIYNGTAGAGNVGIGTTTPGNKLSVYGAGDSVPLASIQASDSISYLHFYNSSTGTNGFTDGVSIGINALNGYILNREAGDLNLGTNNSTDITILNGGNVGIGTTAPSQLLTIGNSGATSNIVNSIQVNGRFNGGGNLIPFASLILSNSADAGSSAFKIIAAEGGNTNGVSAQFQVNNATAAGVPLTAMTLQYDGNIGIGTATPGAKLAISAGDILIDDGQAIRSGVSYGASLIGRGTGAAAAIAIGSGQAGDYLKFNSGGSERVRIDTAGNVGIGTTAPGYLLDLKEQTAGSAAIGFMDTDNMRFGVVGFARQANDLITGSVNTDLVINNAYSTNMLLGTNNIARVYIKSDGNVGIGTTGPTNLLHVNAGTGQAMTVAGGQVGGLNSTPLNADQAVPLGYLQANYTSSLWRGTLNGTIYNGTTGAGNVGIGTTGPTNKLQIGSGGAGYGGNDFVIGNGTQVMAIDANIGGSTTFYTNTSFSFMNSGVGSTGYVGIGTAGPSQKLTLDGAGSSQYLLMQNGYSGNKFLVGNDSVGGTSMYSQTSLGADNPFHFFTGSNERLTILSGGNVGIGTTGPSGRLEVSSSLTGSTLNTIIARNTAATGYSGVDIYNDAGKEFWVGMGGSSVGGSWGNNGVMVAYGTANLILGTSGAEKVRIDTNGNVGIGTTAPGQALHVYNSNGALGYKTARFDSNDTSNGTRIVISNSGNTAANNYGFISGGSGQIGADKFSIARLNTDSTYSDYKLMVFDSAGNVGIGTTNPLAKLELNNNGFVAMDLTDSSQSANSKTFRMINYNSVFYLQAMDDARTTPSGQMVMNRLGNVGIATTTPTEKLEVAGNAKATSFIYSSDRNLKQNITTITNPLDKILQLRGVTFNWKADNKASVGLIAQEVKQVFPELVVGEEGNYGVQYGNLVAPLIEAVKEQQKQIEELKAGQKDYDLLKARVKKLETKSYKK